MTRSSLLQIPPGAQCFYGREARVRRALERRVAEVFTGWSYEEILLPLFDYEDVFVRGGGPSDRASFYRFVGREGELLALRPDFTALVAKVVASRMADRPLPLRLFYRGEVLRYQPPVAGRQAELYQIGLEHIGDGVRADLEILLVALEALERLGVEDAVLTLGHAGFVLGLLDEAGFAEAARREMLEPLRAKDRDGLRLLLEGAEPPSSLLEAMSLCGDRSVLDRAEPLASDEQSRAALDRLQTLGQELHRLGVGDRFQFDLGEVRGFDYYTGMVFEVHASGAGLELGGGGRYDRLFGKFDLPRPAVGFSLSVDRLARRLVDRPVAWMEDAEGELVEAEAPTDVALSKALALRRRNKKVTLQ